MLRPERVCGFARQENWNRLMSTKPTRTETPANPHAIRAITDFLRCTR